jgi:SPP1 family predicted phage head-tail adaptor
MMAGALRHRVAIEQVAATGDGYGGRTESWTVLATVWAAVEPLSGREYFQAQQAQAKVTHKVTMRYRSGVTPGMRVKHGSRYFGIVSVLDTGEKNRELVLMCEEAV